MLFSYNWLQSFFNNKLPKPAELAQLIMKRSFEVEKTEKQGNDTIFDIAILSNRPDCFAHSGMAIEIGAILGIKPSLPVIKLPKTGSVPLAKSLVDVEVVAPAACPRYSAKVVAGIKIGPSPKWLQERLSSCGLRAINNVVDATNYVMLETGQPLHAFDLDKLENQPTKSKIKKIIIRFAKKGETIDLLDGQRCRLAPETLLICDQIGALAVAGIKGGKRAEISRATKNIVIESANFNPQTVRRAARNLGLLTDASLRFEHSLDANQTAAAADRAADLIARIAGGQILAGTIDRHGSLAGPKKITFDLARAEILLGTNIQSAKAKKILELLGMTVRKGVGANLEVTVPTRRADIATARDLAEEIGRISGYDLVQPKLPAAEVVPPAINYDWFWKNAAKDALVAAGYSETRSYTFLSADDCKKWDLAQKDLLEVANPVNADLVFLRPSLLPNLAKSIVVNHDNKVLRQFEIGKVFARGKRMEPVMLAGIDRNGSFLEAKGALELLCRKLGISQVKVLPPAGAPAASGLDWFDADERGQVLVDGKPIGMIGRLSAAISEKINAAAPVVFELEFDVLAQFATQEITCRPLSIYPEAVRDLSVDIPVQTLAVAVIDAVRAADNAKLVKSIEIPEPPYVFGKTKNILFKFHLHSDLKTLNSDEINEWQEKTIEAIEKTPGWKVKKEIKN